MKLVLGFLVIALGCGIIMWALIPAFARSVELDRLIAENRRMKKQIDDLQRKLDVMVMDLATVSNDEVERRILDDLFGEGFEATDGLFEGDPYLVRFIKALRRVRDESRAKGVFSPEAWAELEEAREACRAR